MQKKHLILSIISCFFFSRKINSMNLQRVCRFVISTILHVMNGRYHDHGNWKITTRGIVLIPISKNEIYFRDRYVTRLHPNLERGSLRDIFFVSICIYVPINFPTIISILNSGNKH